MDERERKILAFMLTGFPRLIISLVLLLFIVALLWGMGAFKE